MWLINVNTYKLHQFFGEDIPPYAILSHTWDGDEVTFQDLEKLLLESGQTSTSLEDFSDAQNPDPRWNYNITRKKGFKKIKYCCEQAHFDELQWAWVDTCCIDKTSSSELSEAINSMFQWYQTSKRCYAFLNDVEIHDGPGQITSSERDQQLRNSRWFTRGWTLQELIAPSKMKFYDQKWSFLGFRHDLADVIRDITRIPWSLLGPAETDDLRLYSIAQKLSWAATRDCTRIEDTAYCLLGILGVNMPLLYGEGGKAFIRLQEELFKSTDDHSLLAWTVPENDSRCWSLGGVLAASPREFIHSGEVVALHEELGDPSQVTKKGLQISVHLARTPVSKELPYPYRKHGLWKTVHAILNCVEKRQNSEYQRVVLPIVADHGLDSAVEVLRCYSRILTPWNVTVQDETYFKDLSTYKTIFLRTLRHRFSSEKNESLEISLLPASRKPTPAYTKPIHVHINGVPFQHPKNETENLLSFDDGEESYGYSVAESTYSSNRALPLPIERIGLQNIRAVGDYFILHITLQNHSYRRPVRARCGFWLPYVTSTYGEDCVYKSTRGQIILSLNSGMLPYETVHFRRYADITSVWGCLAKVSLVVGDLKIELETSCEPTWHRGVGKREQSAWRERRHVHFSFSFFPSTHGLPDNPSTLLNRGEDLFPWVVEDLFVVFEKSAYYLANGAPPRIREPVVPLFRDTRSLLAMTSPTPLVRRE